MTNELKTLRANIMGGMNAYVLTTVEDEDILNYWWTYGLPDEVNEDMLMEYAEDDNLWLDVIHAFAKILRME